MNVENITILALFNDELLLNNVNFLFVVLIRSTNI